MISFCKELVLTFPVNCAKGTIYISVKELALPFPVNCVIKYISVMPLEDGNEL